MNILEYSYLIPLFPIIAFLIIAFFGNKIKEGGAPISIIFVGISLTLSLLTIYEIMNRETKLYEQSIEWVAFGNVKIKMGIYIDELTSLMLFVVAFISFLVVIYSWSYMGKEEGKPRYYAEISLFIGVMFGLVMANNYLLMFIFWELVGLCSYLLIGFWYKKPSAASAAKKAFIVTRVGDIMLLGGVVILFTQFGTFEYSKLFSPENLKNADTSMLTLATLLLFGGAIGKSAQFPLHVWLPDAMEGPTTVSALIHAATMVKAGVFLVARSYPLMVGFNGATHEIIVRTPETLLVIAIIGGITALISSSMALVCNDIKRIIAYSTISSLGFMMLALGTGYYFIGGYTAGMFYLFNHALFKALLFLCAGSVIHAIGTNDIQKMGGLSKYMKITSITMLIGALSLSGIPPFSGFFGKDEVLISVFKAGEYNYIYIILFFMALWTALLTAFFIFRLWFKTFTGEERGKFEGHRHSEEHHSPFGKLESPYTMIIPLIILGFFAIFSGLTWYFGFSEFIYFGEKEHAEINLIVISLGSIFAFSGVGLAYIVYYKKSVSEEIFVSSSAKAFLYKMLDKKYYMDDLYIGFAEKVVYGTAKICDWFDRNIVDGITYAINDLTISASKTWRKIQNGLVQSYMAWIVFGIIALLILIKYVLPKIGGI